MFKKFNFLNMKLAFENIYLKIDFTKLSKNLLYMFNVFFFSFYYKWKCYLNIFNKNYLNI